MNCKTCEKSFHYCSSCEMDLASYRGYCSSKCFEESETYMLGWMKLYRFMRNLSAGQTKMFKELMCADQDSDGEYWDFVENYFDRWIKEIEEKLN